MFSPGHIKGTLLQPKGNVLQRFSKGVHITNVRITLHKQKFIYIYKYINIFTYEKFLLANCRTSKQTSLELSGNQKKILNSIKLNENLLAGELAGVQIGEENKEHLLSFEFKTYLICPWCKSKVQM